MRPVCNMHIFFCLPWLFILDDNGQSDLTKRSHIQENDNSAHLHELLSTASFHNSDSGA